MRENEAVSHSFNTETSGKSMT